MMNVIEQARQGYSPASSSFRSGRSAEQHVIVDITSKLRRSAVTQETRFGEFAVALHNNRELWVRLAVDVANEKNLLPLELRSRIFSLTDFVGRHTAKVLRRVATVDVLLDLNMAILRGLQEPDTARGAA